MKKSTKGALAASTAGLVLLGGAGSLAFWTSSQDVAGTTIASGHMLLNAPTCDGWELDGGTAYTDQPLVPGDSLTQHCTLTVDASGAHLAADFAVTGGGFTGAQALLDAVTPTAAYTVNGAAVGTSGVAIKNGDTVGVDLTLAWPAGTTADNTSNVVGGLGAALGDITITATQHHQA